MIDTIKKMLEESGNNKKAVDILDKALKWNNVRYEFLSKRKLLNSIELLLYLPFYQTGKRYILDVLLVTLNKTRGSN